MILSTIPAQSSDDFAIAALAPGLELLRQSDLPTMLSRGEVARYQRIFALQRRAAWSAAEREIAGLKDRLLLGHVLSQRYLAPSYRASYEELDAWLAGYADEPDAKAIYRLALARRPRGVPPPHRPVTPDWGHEDPAGVPALDGEATDPPASPRAALVERQIRLLASTAPLRAETLLDGPEARRLLAADTREELRAGIDSAFLATGKAQEALVLGSQPRTAAAAGEAQWNAGLADWRLGRMDEARRHFETLARSPGLTAWTRAAAAFWAARASSRTGHRDEAAHWLGIAAEHAHTFYGLLARQVLGVGEEFDFEAEPFTDLDARMLMSLDGGRRALALIAVGEREEAADELRALAQRNSPALLQSLAGLADRAGLSALSLEIAGALSDADGRAHDRARYPLPHWTPSDGFSVDRALLFAVMRQESLFVPHSRSYAGALGLMQLMPATARSLAERRGVTLGGRGRTAEEARALADPKTNLTLAQDYVQMLLDDERIKGNLLLFALAYNRGPTAVERWQADRRDFRQDPLLYLESVPEPQARIYAQRVLTNYWIYRTRLGQATPDLAALARGDWPIYSAQDQDLDQDDRHVAIR